MFSGDLACANTRSSRERYASVGSLGYGSGGSSARSAASRSSSGGRARAPPARVLARRIRRDEPRARRVAREARERRVRRGRPAGRRVALVARALRICQAAAGRARRAALDHRAIARTAARRRRPPATGERARGRVAAILRDGASARGARRSDARARARAVVDRREHHAARRVVELAEHLLDRDAHEGLAIDLALEHDVPADLVVPAREVGAPRGRCEQRSRGAGADPRHRCVQHGTLPTRGGGVRTKGHCS